ncbi:MAG: tRNA threonylcarbamoyladenosine dehydratase [Clostridia bacterium]|nr:tRNA threonylcarbamoyladenosine dehydratase [Clostridia bacterium]
MLNQFSKTESLLGKNNMKKLKQSHIIVFGLGGVGSYVVESLVRSGITKLDIVDNDKICLTNLNRQIFATQKTIGRDKVDVAEERIYEINPNCKVKKWKCFYLPENSSQFNFSKYDYVIDAIDTITAKIEIVKNAKNCNIPIISCMGTGNKLDPTAFMVADIYQTSVCPLAKVMRKLCKDNGIDKLKVVYSKETPLTPILNNDINRIDKVSPGSVSFVPSVAGLIIASEVIKDLIKR